jgi:hypothetical protein
VGVATGGRCREVTLVARRGQSAAITDSPSGPFERTTPGPSQAGEE